MTGVSSGKAVSRYLCSARVASKPPTTATMTVTNSARRAQRQYLDEKILFMTNCPVAVSPHPRAVTDDRYSDTYQTTLAPSVPVGAGSRQPGESRLWHRSIAHEQARLRSHCYR